MIWRNVVQFLATILTALALVPGRSSPVRTAQQDWAFTAKLLHCPKHLSGLVTFQTHSATGDRGRPASHDRAKGPAQRLLVSARGVSAHQRKPCRLSDLDPLGEYRDEQLDGGSHKLAAAPRAVGILACRRRDSRLLCVVLDYFVSSAVIATLTALISPQS